MSRAPLDIAALRAKKAELDAAKPRFLTLAQRQEQQAALEFQRRAELAEQRASLTNKRQAIGGSDATDIGQQQGGLVIADKKKKKRRINDVSKFTFDWAAEDDTVDVHDPLYVDRLHVTKNTANGHHMNGNKNVKRDAETDQHWSKKSREEMRERDWRIFKEDFSIQIKGNMCPNPIRSWEEGSFPASIMTVIKANDYKEPTAIQKAAIPIALQARDLIGIAETGSGKTASFVLPMLVHISTLPPLTDATRNNGPYAIVLAPTRELAQQIETETRKFSTGLGLTVVSLVGGRAIEEQSFNLKDGAEIVIATPGRLLDCLERQVLVLSQCAYVVMDEADRMVDLGFEEAVNQVLDALPAHNKKPDFEPSIDMSTKIVPSRLKYRQTIMYSATMPSAVEKLARKYLQKPATVIIGNAGQAVNTVEQRIEVVNGEEKRKLRMEEILNSGEFDRPVIVFVNTKRACDTLAKYLHTIGWSAATMHGGKTQDQRETALRNLRSGEADVLVATDLAGRGIDVANVSLVVNFDMSKTIEDYVHRIGRTGRAGKKGVAVTFLGSEDEEMQKAIRTLQKR